MGVGFGCTAEVNRGMAREGGVGQVVATLTILRGPCHCVRIDAASPFGVC